MPAIEEYIKRINGKLQQLVKQYGSLQKENKRLKQDLEETKKKLNEQLEQTSLMEQRVEILKAAQGTITTEEKKVLEKRIQQYIKEIDKCINFMNE